MKLKSFWLTLGFVLGWVLLYAGERLMGSGTSRTVLSSLGGALLLLSTVLRAVRWASAQGDRKNVEGAFLALAALGLAGALVYFLQSDVWKTLVGKALSQSSPKLSTVLGALWPVLVMTSVLPLFFGELAYASMAKAPVLEKGRVHDAVRSGLGVAAALVFAFALGYVAEQRDPRWDLSYFRTAKPGDSTRKIVRGLSEPVGITLFWPPASEVGEQVEEYFNDLSKESPMLKVTKLDQALEPAKARELGVSANGLIVVHKGTRKEQMVVGTDIERARGQLRNMDKDVQMRLLQVARSQRVVYLTAGHEERGSTPPPGGDQRSTTRSLREMLSSQNYDVRDLSSADGLANAIPADAGAVLVLGPTKPFLPEEIASLTKYLQRGGRLLIALDPEPKLDFSELLAPFGVKYVPTVLANDKVFLQQSGQASDRTLILTATYSSHPSVTNLGQLGQRAPLILVNSGYFDELAQKPPEAQGDGSVRSQAETWNDLNGNFQFDAPAEQRRDYVLAWSGTRREPNAKQGEEARLLALADSEILSDAVLQNAGNAYLALDGMKWVLGDEAISGAINSEVDVAIQHTRKQDVAWFYLTIFGMPALVLGAGFLITRGRGGRKKQRLAGQTAEVAR
jgi:hypothetical protein